MLRLIATICTGAVLICRAAPVFWLPAKNIVDTNDVVTAGTLKYAVSAAFSDTIRSVNGVRFSASKLPPNSGGVVLSGNSAVRTAHYSLPPYINLTADYKGILDNAWISSQSGSVTGIVSGLTLGKRYSIQVWGNNSSDSVVPGKEYVMTFLVTNSPSRVLDFNVGNDLGLLGQHIVGHFVADEETQRFIVKASTYSYVFINAIQVREDVPLNRWSGTDGLVRPEDFDADGLLAFEDLPGVSTNTFAFAAPVTNKLFWFLGDETVYRPVASNKLMGGDVFLSGAAPIVWIGSNTVSNVVISSRSTLQFGESRTNGGLLRANAVWCWGTLRWTGSGFVSLGSAGVYMGGGTFCVDSSGVVEVAADQLGFTGLVSVVSGTLRLGRNAALRNAVYRLERDGCCEALTQANPFQARGLSGSGKLRLKYSSTSRGATLTGPVEGTGLQIEPVGLPSLTNGFTWQVFSAPAVSGTFDLTISDSAWRLSNPDGKSLWFVPHSGTLLRLR